MQRRALFLLLAPGRDPIYGLGILTLDKPSRLAQAAQSSNN